MGILSTVGTKAQDYPKTSTAVASATLATLFGSVVTGASFLVPYLRSLPIRVKLGIIAGSGIGGAVLPILGYGGYKGSKQLYNKWKKDPDTQQEEPGAWTQLPP